MLFTVNYCSPDGAEAEDNSQLQGLALEGLSFTRSRSFASPARTARTKRKRRRNEADLPVTGGRTSRTSSPKPPIYVGANSMEYVVGIPKLFFGGKNLGQNHQSAELAGL